MPNQMQAPVFPTIPVPTDDPKSLRATVEALKVTVEILAGNDTKSRDGTQINRFSQHCYVQPTEPKALHAGDTWLCTNHNWTFSIWTGSEWRLLVTVP